MALPNSFLLSLVVCILAMRHAEAHPPSAIVVDDQGRVFYTDAEEGVFCLQSNDRSIRIHPAGMHWMALDRRGAFAETPETFGEWFGRVTPKGESPALISCSDFPCAIGSDGNLYFAKMHGLAVIRRTPQGDESVLINADDYGLDLSRAWGVNGMTCAADGTIYVVALDSANRHEGSGEHVLYGIDKGGRPTEIARNFINDEVPEGEEHPEVRPQYCRGMAVDERRTVFIAVTGSHRVIKVTPRGEVSVVVESTRPWSPTGVDVFEGSLYVLEYDDEKPVQQREWPLRVRKVTPEGEVSTLVAVRSE